MYSYRKIFSVVRRQHKKRIREQSGSYRSSLKAIVGAALGRVLDPIEYAVLDDRGLAYVVNSKAGCSSIKGALLVARGMEVAGREYQEVHDLALKSNLTTFDLDREQRGYFKFSFVRDPFARIASLYVNKFTDQAKISKTGFEYRSYLASYIPREVSFDKFVRLISNIPDELSERHFKSQHFLLEKEAGGVDYVGKLENFSEDFSTLATRFGLSIPPVINQSRSYDPAALYCPESLRVVAKRYEADIETYGYASAFDRLKGLV